MTLSIREKRGDDQVEWIDNWPFPTLPTLIASHAFELLKRELGRYVRNEVPGRAFLVSGHRGAGKTTLVVRAIDELNREILRRNLDGARQPAPDGRIAVAQRPLIVRLHGPSLLRASPSAGEGADPGPDLVIGALEQIMVALYRAFAGEIGRGATQLANATLSDSKGRSPSRNDLAEAAAQFILDLDNAPKPALLRESYDRLGCLRTGVLWPRDVGTATVRAGLQDQGMREIVALATAAQAFEICAGEVKSSEATTQSSSNARSIEWKIDLALADAINKALGLAAGIAIGVGGAVIGNGSPGSIAAGAAIGLVTAATYSRSAKRAISSEKKTEYSFIRDRTKKSLDKDLPGVIQRIRDAGLAPVFVVDELDKVANPDANIASFVNEVKHLTTDFGAFCFLTDRAYFDTVMSKIVAQPFPPEHTYFSHWLFVLQDTSQILEYLAKAIAEQPSKGLAATHSAPDAHAGLSSLFDQSPVPAPAVEDLPRTILALHLLHRSKLNAVDLFREIGRCCDERGRVRATPGTISSSFGLRMAATIQLAVHVVLKQAAMRERIEADPRFAQSAVDALYILSRAWESGAADVILTRAAIAEQVAARMEQRAARTSNDADPVAEGSVSNKRDLDFLEEHVSVLATLLSDLPRLIAVPDARLGEGLAAPPSQVAPLELTSRLIEEVAPDSRRYRFLYDVQGREIRVRDAVAADASSGGPTNDLRTSAARVADAEQLRSLFKGLIADLDDAIAAGILPPALHAVTFDNAVRRLRSFRDGARPYEDLASDLQLLDVLEAFLDRHFTDLADVMRLAIEVASAAGSSVGTAVRAIGKCIDLSSSFGHQTDLDHTERDDASSVLSGLAGRPDGERTSDADAQSAAPDGLRALFVELDDYRQLLSIRTTSTSNEQILDQHVRTCWELWMHRLQVHAAENWPVIDAAHFSDIVCVAADRAPGSLFEMDLRHMTVAAWSALCLRGFPEMPDDLAPGWSFVAGLWGLGFDRGLLAEASATVRVDAEGCASLVQAMIAAAPVTRVRSIILVMSEDGPSLGSRTDHRPEDYGHPSNRKILALRDHELSLYSRALAWLEKHGAVIGLSYEE